MLRGEITVTLPGRPAPKGSMKCIGGRRGRHQLVEQLAKTQKPWREHITRLFRGRVTQTADPRQPVGVEVTFTLERPTSHLNARGELRAAAPLFPTGQGTGDVDKLARLLLDALESAGTLPNDAQVVDLHTLKGYVGGPFPGCLPYPGATIRVFPVGPGTPQPIPGLE